MVGGGWGRRRVVAAGVWAYDGTAGRRRAEVVASAMVWGAKTLGVLIVGEGMVGDVVDRVGLLIAVSERSITLIGKCARGLEGE